MSWSPRSPLSCITLPIFFLFVSFLLFSPSNAVPDFPVSGDVSNGDRRRIAESVDKNSSIVLAEKRTYRKDPLDGYKYYTGGWNITNRHYWASVGYKSAPFLLAAQIWFLVFGFGLLFSCICCCCCCCCPYPTGYSKACYFSSLFLLLLLAVAAIVGSAFLYTGEDAFYSNTKDALYYIVSQADATARNLTGIASCLGAAKSMGVDVFTLPETIQNKVGQIQTSIVRVARILQVTVRNNAKKFQTFLTKVGTILVAIAAVMLFLVFLGFLFSYLGMECLVYSLLVLGWLLVTITLFLCGIFLLIHNVVTDSCVAVDEWVHHPNARSALAAIVPCVRPEIAWEIEKASKDVNRQFVSVVDDAITTVFNGKFEQRDGSFYFNQSGPPVPPLCNPYNQDRSERKCAEGEVTYETAPKEWKKYECRVSEDGRTCVTQGRLNPTTYGQLTSAANLSYGLHTYSPFLINLVDCNFVFRVFKEISSSYCPGISMYTRWIYYGLFVLSAALIFSLIFWVFFARERSHRIYAKRLLPS